MSDTSSQRGRAIARAVTSGAFPMPPPEVAAALLAALGTTPPTLAQHNGHARGAGDGHDPRSERLLGLVRRFARARVLVVGDMVVDEYIVGTPAGISREAPIIILRERERFTVPGGAINPGANARALGAEVYLAGIAGSDASGQRLRAMLDERDIHRDGLVEEPGRPTTTKTRILAGNPQVVQQQVARIDQVDNSPPSPACERAIVDYLQRTVPAVDAVIISDYENGAVTPALIGACLPLALELGKVVVVDSHGDLRRFQGATALTPNQPEAEATLGMRIGDDSASLDEAGRRLLAETTARGVLITRGSAGMSLFERDQPPVHLPAANQTMVLDTTGAGDTVSATFTLALVVGATMAEAAVLSTLAAGLVVRQLGCATNTSGQLVEAIIGLMDTQ
jgi:rfaE bifunctional protein kinase chain/domain